jgi:hypothetical protein
MPRMAKMEKLGKTTWIFRPTSRTNCGTLMQEVDVSGLSEQPYDESKIPGSRECGPSVQAATILKMVIPREPRHEACPQLSNYLQACINSARARRDAVRTYRAA